jgi:hypothetical protein
MSESDDTTKRDIIRELKDAAAFMDAVKEISKDVDGNKILNGGDNSTEVKVETTLDGDVVDRAIESVQRKAENLRNLITTLIPVFLLLTGGGLEAFGVIDIFENEGETSPIASSCGYGIDWVDWTWEDDELNVFGNLWTDCETISTESLDTMVVIANAFDSENPTQEWVVGNIDIYDWYQDSNFYI